MTADLSLTPEGLRGPRFNSNAKKTTGAFCSRDASALRGHVSGVGPRGYNDAEYEAWAKCIARDTRLRREVAVKVLQESFASDVDRK